MTINDSAGAGGGGGMLSSGLPPRKPFLTLLLDLYKSEASFRGMADFAAIGFVVMSFLSPVHKVNWPWSGGGSMPSICSPGSPGCGTTALPSSGSGGSISVPKTSGPVVPIPFPDVIKAPKLSLGFMFDIDDAQFRSSISGDQSRLKAARTSIAYRRSEEAVEHLRSANGSDPNVSLLRGAAFILRDTAEANRSAEALWRAAQAGGNKQAAGLLGRLLASGRSGIAANAAEGQRLIEAGASAGDRQAMRFAGMGYLSGEFGRLDPFKAAQYFRQAADAGDGMSAAFFSRMAAEGIAIPAPDGKLAEAYLRKASSSGVTTAQATLGRWLIAQFRQGLALDLKEASDWLLKAYEHGHDIDALNDLAVLHTVAAKSPPWLDNKKGFGFVRQCSGFSQATCQFNTALGWEKGHYGPSNAVLARAHFAIASSLGYQQAASNVQRLDGGMTASDKTTSANIEAAIRATLKPIPAVIALQYQDLRSPPPPSAISLDRLPGTVTQPGITHQQSPLPAQVPASAATTDLKSCQTSATEASQRLQACTRVIQAATSSNADIAEAHDRRGDIRMNANQHNEAFADYAEAVRRVPNNATYIYDRGRAQLARGKFKAALEDYEASLRIKERNVWALSGRADALRQLGNLADALVSVNMALDIEPRQVYPLNVRGDVHLAAGRLAQAMNDFQLAASIPGHSAYPHYRMAAIQFDTNRFDDAVNQIDQAITQHGSQDANHFILKARAQAGNRQYSAADATMTALIQREPNNSLAYQWRGVLRFTEWSAINDWCKGGRKGPAPVPNALSYDVIGGSGNTLCSGAQGAQTALQDLNMALDKNPKNSEAHFHAARVLAATNNLPAAVQAYTAAIRINPTSGAYNNRGGVYVDLGQPELAIGDFNEAIRLDPKNKYAWASRGAFLAKRNRQQAIADYRRALDIDDRYGFAINGLRQLGVRP